MSGNLCRWGWIKRLEPSSGVRWPAAGLEVNSAGIRIGRQLAALQQEEARCQQVPLKKNTSSALRMYWKKLHWKLTKPCRRLPSTGCCKGQRFLPLLLAQETKNN